MTRSDYKQWVDENFTFLAISDAYSLIDKIFENCFEELQAHKTCDGCIHSDGKGGCYLDEYCNRDDSIEDHYQNTL